ncbi:MAG: magnesium and cobalt exporter, family [Clostridiales bacterium]|nr:magnesium and cobalt exporter, family [Clostridiales bacterium]
MDPDSIWQLIALILLLMLSAFFSASETALTSVNKIRLRQLIDSGNKTAALISKMLESPDRWLSAILVGNNVVNIGASALATSFAINQFGSTGVGIATGAMTLAVLIFSEITPKSLANNKSEGIALVVARPIYGLMLILRPIIFVLSGITNFLLMMFGVRKNQGQASVTEEELKTMMDVSHEEGQLETDEKRLLEKVFEFGDEQVRYVMIPRTEVSAISLDDNYFDIRDEFEKTRFSRLPVYDESLDNIIGILHMKDFFLYSGDTAIFDVSKLIRKAYYTIESKRIADLFEEMRSKKQQMAIVVDEYGGTAGIITTQDIVEIIFGDIDDEYDTQDSDIQQLSDHEYIAKGSLRLKDLNEATGLELETEDYDTIGGLVIGKLGTFPGLGETVMLDGIICQVLDRSRTKINKLHIRVCQPDNTVDVDKDADNCED